MTSYSSDFDELDIRIAMALQANGRATWGLIASVLNVPVRTVARRGQRLVESGAVQVSTYLDTTVVGDARPLLIQVGTPPGDALGVAHRLAERSDASSVSVLESGADVICLLMPRTASESTRLVVEDLPRVGQLTSVRVSTLLKFFRSGFDWTALPLSDDLLTRLRDWEMPVYHDGAARMSLSPEDEKLISILVRDGRASVSDLAERVGFTPPTVKRRLEALMRGGALHVRTEVSSVLHGLRVEALTWVQLPPDRIETVGRALGRHPSVRFCAACTGPAELLVDCVLADEHALYRFLTEDVAALGVTSAQTSVVLVPVRRGPMLVSDGLEMA